MIIKTWRLYFLYSSKQLIANAYDQVVLASGIRPRKLDIEGVNHPSVLSYIDVIQNRAEVGERVAIIGAGGIGFDVAEFLAHEGESPSLNVQEFNKEWGVDSSYQQRGGLAMPAPDDAARKIVMLQRKTTKVGKGLGKPTGWIHRAALQMKNVQMISGASYQKIDDDGLHVVLNGNNPKLIECDTIVVCAGQLSKRDLVDNLEAAGLPVHLIGGSKLAGELDAKRAILEGF